MSLIWSNQNTVILRLVFLIVFYLVANTAKAESVFTYIIHPNKSNKHLSYSHNLLLLALEKTVASHGSFRMNYIPVAMNTKRARFEVKKNTYPNLIYPGGGTNDFFEQYQYAPFPIDLGIWGYRFPMLHKDNIGLISKETTLAELKALSIVQGIGWVDAKILRSNGFSSVTEVKSTSIDETIVHKRSDVDVYFCSMNDTNRYQEQPVAINKDIALHYEYPRFFISSKGNKSAIERIYAGLIIAYQDGSLSRLIDKHFLEEINKLDISHRKTFQLDNLFQQGLDKRYQTWKGLHNEYINSRIK